MNITLHIGTRTLKATLTDSEPTRDLVSLLTLEDYAGTEKIAYLPGTLTTRGAPAGSTPRAGDLTSSAPWGNLALFHRDFSSSSGLILPGRLDGGVDPLREPGKVKVTIEPVR